MPPSGYVQQHKRGFRRNPIWPNKLRPDFPSWQLPLPPRSAHKPTYVNRRPASPSATLSPDSTSAVPPPTPLDVTPSFHHGNDLHLPSRPMAIALCATVKLGKPDHLPSPPIIPPSWFSSQISNLKSPIPNPSPPPHRPLIPHPPSLPPGRVGPAARWTRLSATVQSAIEMNQATDSEGRKSIQRGQSALSRRAESPPPLIMTACALTPDSLRNSSFRTLHKMRESHIYLLPNGLR